MSFYFPRNQKLRVVDTGSTSGLIQLIRNLINEPSVHPTIYELKTFNQICSALDVIGDTELIIAGYKRGEYCPTLAGCYLTVYGLLNSLYVQISAVEHLADALGVKYKKRKELTAVRDIRKLTAAHPTSASVRSKERFAFLSRISLTPQSYELRYYDKDNRLQVDQVDLIDLLETHEDANADQLYLVYEHLVKEYTRLSSDPLPKGTLSTEFTGIKDEIRELKIDLERIRPLDVRLNSIEAIAKRILRLRRGLKAAGKDKIGVEEIRKLTSKTRWLKGFLRSQSEPSAQTMHLAMFMADEISELFDSLLDTIFELEENDPKQTDTLPVIDISLKDRARS